MELYLIRHGQSEGNTGVDATPDPPLTEIGEKQMKLTAERLKGEGISQLYCSTTKRALKSAEILGRELNLRPKILTILAEKGTSFGYRGMEKEEIEREFPDVIIPEDYSPYFWQEFDNETDEEAYQRAERVEKFFRNLYQMTPKRIAAITHGTFGSILISKILGAPYSGYTLFSQNNACITQIEITEDKVKMRYQNFTGHLPKEIIT